MKRFRNIVFGLVLPVVGSGLVAARATGDVDGRAGMGPGMDMNMGSPGETATYRLTFVPTWNETTHPFEYPTSHALQGLLTPVIGATHGLDYRIFSPGTQPTPGLERLSEMGKHDPLDSEIRAAVAAGKVGTLIESSQGSPGPIHEPVTTTFVAERRFPMVSIVGMIAPSPDWFYGVSSVPLFENGAWVPCVTVQVYAWESGGDGGTTYLAEDLDLNPKEPTRRLQCAHFMQGGEIIPVGTFVFQRVPAMAG